MTSLFLRDHCILTAKSALPGTVSSDGYFLEITGFLGRTLHYQEMTLCDDFFFRNHLESRTKIGLARFWHANHWSQRSLHATGMLTVMKDCGFYVSVRI